MNNARQKLDYGGRFAITVINALDKIEAHEGALQYVSPAIAHILMHLGIDEERCYTAAIQATINLRMPLENNFVRMTDNDMKLASLLSTVQVALDLIEEDRITPAVTKAYREAKNEKEL